MIKISIFLIFIFHIVDANLYQFYNFSMNPENSQPSGSINYNHIFFRKNYKSYALENNNKMIKISIFLIFIFHICMIYTFHLPQYHILDNTLVRNIFDKVKFDCC